MTGRALRPIEDILQDYADLFRVDLRFMPVQVASGAATFRVSGVSDHLYLLGRLEGARYEAILRIMKGGADHILARWRGRDDEGSRSPDIFARTKDWPAGWPPTAPPGLSDESLRMWDLMLRDRPYGLEYDAQQLEAWIRSADRPHDQQPLREIMKWSARLGGSPMHRKKVGIRHEQERST